MELDISRFLNLFFAYMFLYYPKEMDPESKIADTPQERLWESYNIIIVGGGTAGCVLARRLTENPSLTVLLIEAGGDEDPLTNNPLIYRAAFSTDSEWSITTVRQSRLCLAYDNNCSIRQGHLLGGTSALFDPKYSRGTREDYDGWAELGNKDWSFQNVLPYFKKMENYKIPFLGNSPEHGYDGPLTIRYPRFSTKLKEEYIRAGEEFGWKIRDYNGKNQRGIDYTQFTLDGATKLSNAEAYLYPARKRKNLTVIKRSLVSKVLIGHNNRAEGVEYLRGGKKYRIGAKNEVILTGGAVNTPKLLMLSGVGPREELKKHRIPLKCDLPVGKNLKDHPGVDIYFELNQRLTIVTKIWRTNQSISDYAIHGSGPLTTPGDEATAHFNVFNKEGTPNAAIHFFSTVPYDQFQEIPVITVRIGLLQPRSTGEVTLRSLNPYDRPIVNPNYLASETDFKVLESAIRTVLEYMKTPTMRKYSPKIFTGYQQECDGKIEWEFFTCIIARYGNSLSHPSGTARMGPSTDVNSVVTSSQLKVRCLENVRVVDASVMPRIIRGSTISGVTMIAEKAAEVILQDYQHKQYDEQPITDQETRPLPAIQTKPAPVSPPKGKPSPPKGEGSPPKEKPSPPKGEGSPPKGKPSPPKGEGSPPKEKPSPPKGEGSPPKGKPSPPKGEGSPPKEKPSPPKGEESSSSAEEDSSESGGSSSGTPPSTQGQTSSNTVHTMSLLDTMKTIIKFMTSKFINNLSSS